MDVDVDRRVDAARSAGASATFARRNTGSSPKTVTGMPRDGAECSGRDETSTPLRARRTVMGETDQPLWDWVRLAHNPEVAGSNPAPATNVVAGQRPFPGWERASCFGSCSQMCSRDRQGIAEKPRSGDSPPHDWVRMGCLRRRSPGRFQVDGRRMALSQSTRDAMLAPEPDLLE